MPYLLATLQIRYGKTPRFVEIMGHLVPVLERQGWQLRGAWVNSIGRLNKAYDLWEIRDANHVQSALATASQDAEFRRWADELSDCLEAEELELMDKLPYSP